MTEKVAKLLKSREFVSVATCDFKGHPNAAPKFLLKVEKNFIFLVDYVIGKTWQNILINPRVSISFVDTDSLIGYRINGPVEIIEGGPAYEDILRDLESRQIDLSTKRIIEGVEKGKVHERFEISLPQRFVVFKVKIEEILEIGPSGTLKSETYA